MSGAIPSIPQHVSMAWSLIKQRKVYRFSHRQESSGESVQEARSTHFSGDRGVKPGERPACSAEGHLESLTPEQGRGELPTEPYRMTLPSKPQTRLTILPNTTILHLK
jgi:hypothetical protein